MHTHLQHVEKAHYIMIIKSSERGGKGANQMVFIIIVTDNGIGSAALILYRSVQLYWALYFTVLMGIDLFWDDLFLVSLSTQLHTLIDFCCKLVVMTAFSVCCVCWSVCFSLCAVFCFIVVLVCVVVAYCMINVLAHCLWTALHL